MNRTEQIAHIIPTHERPGVAQRLINSINEKWPGSNIYVCDDSDKPARYEGANNVRAPAYDIGLSAKRNLLVQKSTEPYIFLWDDDYMATEHTSLDPFWNVLHSLDDVGIVGGEWTLGSGRREVWFTGDFWVEGPIQKHRTPDNIYLVETDEGTFRYHDVMFTPNWFLAYRETVESIFWDEELKLQEHTEFFARLAAARAKRGTPQKEHDHKWLERFNERQLESDGMPLDKNGRVEVYCMSTFRNNTKLSHLPKNLARKGTWIKVDPDYAEDLLRRGYAYTRKEVTDARPFPVPSIDPSIPLGVALTPDSTCLHLRWDDTSKNEDFNKKRDRKDWWPIQRQKLGTEELELMQWSSYQHEEIDTPDPEQIDYSLPNNFEYYD